MNDEFEDGEKWKEQKPTKRARWSKIGEEGNGRQSEKQRWKSLIQIGNFEISHGAMKFSFILLEE